MASRPTEDAWGILIHTDAYAGNFEREMCAHITGRVGECEVGNEFVEQSTLFDDESIKYVSDDNGCSRPCTMYPDSTGAYNSVLIYFERLPTGAEIDLVQTRAHTFIDKWSQVNKNKPYRKLDMTRVLGFSLVHFIVKDEVIPL